MDIDISMLDFWKYENLSRLRFYGWDVPAYTCGISQKKELVKNLIPPNCELERRPSGGGIVAHGDDLTYALVAPRGTRLCEMRASLSYIETHSAIASAFKSLGEDCYLYQPNTSSCCEKNKLYACFSSPARNDVMSICGGKLAGAAQKRNRNGILFQGSIRIPSGIDLKMLADIIAKNFAEMLCEEIEKIDWPF